MFRFKNPRLIHFDTVDEEVGGSGSEAATDSVDTSQSTDSSADSSGVNPAWAPFEQKLDPISFRNIQDELKSMDSEAQKRITSVNEQYKPWKEFADSGVNPEQVQQALQIAGRLNENPEEIYEALGTFLQREGRAPNKQELKEEVEENDTGESPVDDPRLSALEEQNQRMMEFFQQQEEAQVQQRADSELSKEIDTLKSSHPNLDAADVKEVIGRAALIAQQTGKAPTLEEAHASFTALQDRIRNKPRPGDGAPNLPSLSGGLPASASERTLGSLSASEMQNLTAEILNKSK